MTRNNFLRDITVAIAASLLPKILQPCVPVEEGFNWKAFDRMPLISQTIEQREMTMYALNKKSYKAFNDLLIKKGQEYLKNS